MTKDKNRLRAASKKYRQTHKEYLVQYNKDLRKKPKCRYSYVKREGKRRNLEVTISFEEYEILISNPCYYCNDYFKNKIECGIGLDRLNSNFGYISNNVVSCCRICNIIKGDHFNSRRRKNCYKLCNQLQN